MPEAVAEHEAAQFQAVLEEAFRLWLDYTDRDEVPEDLARKTLKRMDEASDDTEARRHVVQLTRSELRTLEAGGEVERTSEVRPCTIVVKPPGEERHA